MIELRRGLVVPGAPGLATVETDGGSLVRAQHHAGGIFRINPELVIVITAGRAAQDRDCLPTILGLVERDIRHVDHVGILRIDGDAIEIPRSTGKTRVSIGEHPGVAAIVRAIEAGLFLF